MILHAALLALCASAVICGQPAATGQFDVASIRLSSADPHSVSGIHDAHGRLEAHNVTLKRCIIGAYGVGPHQVVGGPDWLDSERFEIAAATAQPVNDDAILMQMLRRLLAERFHLVLHRETRTLPAFVLEVAKGGPKLEKAEGGESSTNSSSTARGGSLTARNTSMDLFGTVLARQMELPVVNHTGLDGVFNFQLQWTPDSARQAAPVPGADTEGPTLFTAIQEQLGLRLRAHKEPVEVLIIDRAEKPTEN